MVGVLCDRQELARPFSPSELTFEYQVTTAWNGWEISNLREVSAELVQLVRSHHVTGIVLQMEVWDLMQTIPHIPELADVPLAAVIHAVPFLGNPEVPTTFHRDVERRLKDDLPERERDYIARHSRSAQEVLTRCVPIAANRVVEWYLNHYFATLKPCLIDPPILLRRPPARPTLSADKSVLRFAYLARTDRGKGREWIEPIAIEIAKLLSCPFELRLAGTSSRRSNPPERCWLQQASGCVLEDWGWIADSEKAAFFDGVACMIYPSQSDTMSITMLETLSYGIPIVVWDQLWTRLMYGECCAVVRVPKDDAARFAAAVVRLATDRNELHAATVAASAFVRPFFDRTAVARSEARAYTASLGL